MQLLTSQTQKRLSANKICRNSLKQKNETISHKSLNLLSNDGRTARKIGSGERLKTQWVFKSAEPTDFDDLKIGKIASCAAEPQGFYRRQVYLPERKSLPCNFCLCRLRREQKLVGVAGGAESAEFCGFAKGETATTQIENLRRGTRRGSLLPRPPRRRRASGGLRLRRRNRHRRHDIVY